MRINTRRFDHAIQKAEEQLRAVERRDLGVLTPREMATVLGGCLGGGARIARRKAPGKYDGAVEGGWATAAARLRADIETNRRAKDQAISEAAAKRATGKKC